MDEELQQKFTDLFKVQEIDSDFNCPKCNNGTKLKILRQRMSGPYAGAVTCQACNYRQSLIAFLGASMISVQPLPDGAAILFFNDSDKEKPE